jgi:hypothetical protein
MSSNLIYTNSGINNNSKQLISILSNKNIGINITSPSNNLHVNGIVRSNNNMIIGGNIYINGGGSFNGGWYMSDTTYIRSINDKTIYASSIGGSNNVQISSGYAIKGIGLYPQVTRKKTYLEFTRTSDNSAIGVNFFNSDITLKENFQPINISACDLFEKIDYFSYNYKINPVERIKVGFSAQQLQTLDPQLVFETSTNTLNINTNILSTYMSKAIQELIESNKKKRERINLLKQNISNILLFINK